MASGGHHPFGDFKHWNFIKNILTKEPDYTIIPYPKTIEIIRQMLEKDGEKRPKLVDFFPVLVEFFEDMKKRVK